jgi:F-type H+-transporting ATPase subunit b
MVPKLVAVPLALGAAEGGGILSVNATLVWGTLVVFALFAWVLGKFAWGPLLKIVDDREKGIQEQVDAAEKAAAEAKALLLQHQEMLKGASRERDEILGKTLKEAEQLRAELAGKSRAEAQALVERARQQIEQEKNLALAELRGHVADLAVEAAAKIVRSSLTEEAQRKLVDEYVASLPAAGKGGRA